MVDDSPMEDAMSLEGAPSAEAAQAPRSEVAELRRQLDEKHDRLLRALADAENTRRRAQRERDEFAKYATESLLRDLIPVLDNLDRALDAARAAGTAANLVEGVELIQRELLKVLERAGVTRYSAVGQTFDPSRHEAIARVVSGQAAPNTVVSEQLPGYLLHDRVLRPALVVVAAAPDADACARAARLLRGPRRPTQRDRRGSEDGVPPARDAIPRRPQPGGQALRGALPGSKRGEGG